MTSSHSPTDGTFGFDDEVVIYAQPGIGLYECEKRRQWQEGKVTITSYNIFFEPSDEKSPEVLRFALEDVLRSGQIIRCKTESEFSRAKVLVPLPGDNVNLKYSFPKGGMEEFYSALCLAVKKTEWRKLYSLLGISSSARDTEVNDNSSRYKASNGGGINANKTSGSNDCDDIVASSMTNNSGSGNSKDSRHLSQAHGVSHSVLSADAMDCFAKNGVFDGEDVACSECTLLNVDYSENKCVLWNDNPYPLKSLSTSDAPDDDDDDVVDGDATNFHFSSSFSHPQTGILVNRSRPLSIVDPLNITRVSNTVSTRPSSNLCHSTTRHQCREENDGVSRMEHVANVAGDNAACKKVFSSVQETTHNFDVSDADSETFVEPTVSGEISYPLQACEATCSIPRLEYETAIGSGNMNRSEASSTGDQSNNPIAQGSRLFSVTDRAGIAGVMRASAESAPLDQALRDIDDVMKDASSIVANIRHLKQKQNGPVSPEDDTAIESIEATLGIGAMVRHSHDTLYNNRFYKDLAHELHSWITHEKNFRVFGSAPLIPLIELFALYNKARGGRDLVSPSDVLNACRIMDKRSDSVYRLKHFSSGRRALQHRDPLLVLENLSQILGPRLCTPTQLEELKVSEKNSKDKIRTSSARGNMETTTVFPQSRNELRSINEVQFAARIQVARSVAFDLLEDFEQQGYLCRSSGGFGCVSFHWNVFVY